MEPTKREKLFIITGASGVGKSTASEILFRKEKDYVVLESDLLWADHYNTPEDNYRQYRELWMRLCYNISQIGMPVVLCGCGIPEQFECCDARKYFTDIHYIAVVTREEVLRKRMVEGRKITDENWVNGSVQFNNWFWENGHQVTPSIRLVDGSDLTAGQTAAEIDKIIREYL